MLNWFTFVTQHSVFIAATGLNQDFSGLGCALDVPQPIFALAHAIRRGAWLICRVNTSSGIVGGTQRSC